MRAPGLGEHLFRRPVLVGWDALHNAR